MKISCIIPVYNTSRYLKKCIDSVLKQTYTDFEIVLVNDKSTDNSAEICKQYQSQYSDKIVFIDKPVNEGVDKARFSGLEYVLETNKDGGVTFLDSDDYLNKDSFRQLALSMSKTNSDIVEMKMTRFLGPIKHSHYAPISAQTINQPQLFNDYFISFFGVNILNVSIAAKLYRSEILMKADIKPTKFKMGEDLMFNMKIFPYCQRYTIIDYRGYNYRVGGLTSRYNPTLWEDLKAQYFKKKKVIEEYKYYKAFRTLDFELKNIFMSALQQKIQYLNERDEVIEEWMKKEFDNHELWRGIKQLSVSDNSQIIEAIANKDTKSLIAIAKQRINANKFRRVAKNIISNFIR